MTYNTTTKELSPRERQILALWMQRMEYQAIADMLHVSKRYINKTLDAIQWKRDMVSRKELRTWALENGYDKVEEGQP